MVTIDDLMIENDDNQFNQFNECSSLIGLLLYSCLTFPEIRWDQHSNSQKAKLV